MIRIFGEMFQLSHGVIMKTKCSIIKAFPVVGFFLIFLALCSEATFGAILIVPDQYATIQEAVDHCWGMDLIILQPGTYTGPGNRDITLGSDLCVIGNGSSGEVIIDLQGSDEEEHRAFIAEGYNELSPIYFINITFKNGYTSDNGGVIQAATGMANIDSCCFAGNKSVASGGAIGISDIAIGRVFNCTFEDNSAEEKGGALYGSQLTVGHCTFLSNTAYDGGAVAIAKSGSITESIFQENNSANRGGAVAGFSNLSLKQCSFKNNSSAFSGGAVYGSGLICDIAGCHFYNNKAITGGAIALQYISQFFQITNSILSENSAQIGGGGLWAGESNTGYLEFCSLYANAAISYGGACFAFETADMITGNNIFYENTANLGNAIWLSNANNPERTSLFSIAYSCLDPADTESANDYSTFSFGPGMFGGNPAFIDPQNNGFDLEDWSPCIDAGNPESKTETDVFSQSRPNGSGFDLGAIESSISLKEGLNLLLNDSFFASGDRFTLSSQAVNPASSQSNKVFIILEMNSVFFFFPNWTQSPDYLELLPEQNRWSEKLIDFIWPSGVDSSGNAVFWGALVDGQTQKIIGEITSIEWGFF